MTVRKTSATVRLLTVTGELELDPAARMMPHEHLIVGLPPGKAPASAAS